MDKSSLEFKKADGSPIKFNFELPNGLPYKDILTPNFKVVKSKTNNEFRIYSYYKKEDLDIIKSINFIQCMEEISENDMQIWLISETHYVVFENLNDKIIKELRNKNLAFYFFNENENFIRGFKI